MEIYLKTDTGRVRTSNEDAVGAGEFEDGAVWAAVCDGMGGANGGNVASRVCMQTFEEQLASYRPGMNSNSIKNLLTTAAFNANQAVYARAGKEPALRGMGTTAVLLLAANGVAHLLSVGDSRAFLSGAEGIRQLTRDHTVVQAMVDSGELTEQQAREHPQKHIITKVLGVHPSLDADYSEWELAQGDVLLLCSDGLTNYLTAEEIDTVLQKNPAGEAAQLLIDRALQAGGGDNVTVAIVTNR